MKEKNEKAKYCKKENRMKIIARKADKMKERKTSDFRKPPLNVGEEKALALSLVTGKNNQFSSRLCQRSLFKHPDFK